MHVLNLIPAAAPATPLAGRVLSSSASSFETKLASTMSNAAPEDPSEPASEVPVPSGGAKTGEIPGNDNSSVSASQFPARFPAPNLAASIGAASLGAATLTQVVNALLNSRNTEAKNGNPATALKQGDAKAAKSTTDSTPAAPNPLASVEVAPTIAAYLAQAPSVSRLALSTASSDVTAATTLPSVVTFAGQTDSKVPPQGHGNFSNPTTSTGEVESSTTATSAVAPEVTPSIASPAVEGPDIPLPPSELQPPLAEVPSLPMTTMPISVFSKDGVAPPSPEATATVASHALNLPEPAQLVSDGSPVAASFSNSMNVATVPSRPTSPATVEAETTVPTLTAVAEFPTPSGATNDNHQTGQEVRVETTNGGDMPFQAVESSPISPLPPNVIAGIAPIVDGKDLKAFASVSVLPLGNASAIEETHVTGAQASSANAPNFKNDTEPVKAPAPDPAGTTGLGNELLANLVPSATAKGAPDAGEPPAPGRSNPPQTALPNLNGMDAAPSAVSARTSLALKSELVSRATVDSNPTQPASDDSSHDSVSGAGGGIIVSTNATPPTAVFAGDAGPMGDKPATLAAEDSVAATPMAAPGKTLPSATTNSELSANSGASSNPVSALPLTHGSNDETNLTVIAAAKDTASAPNVAAAPVTVSQDAAATTPAQSAPRADLPGAHQMLDSAPAVPQAPALATAGPGDAASNLPINSQMHVGIRTDAFGAVEIHTVLQQSQVGITVHADRDLAHWFTSEVPGLESGLNQHHLNLTAVDFENGRSGLQSGGGFPQGQPRQQPSETARPPAPGYDGSNRPEALPDSAAAGSLQPGAATGIVSAGFSIHV